MGQKTHPIGFRLGITRTWTSKWYEEKNYARWLHEDFKLKKFIKHKLAHAGVSLIEIERAASKCKINIHTARPGGGDRQARRWRREPEARGSEADGKRGLPQYPRGAQG
jgi:hypothetical protein